MAYTTTTGVSPGTRITDDGTNTVGQVVCNRDGTNIGSQGSGVSRTAAASAAVASGSTAAGAVSVLFVAGSTFSGTVLGQPLAPGQTLAFSANAPDTIAAIAYTRSAGTLYIYTLT